MASSDLVVLAVDGDHAIARNGNLVVALWIRETRADSVQRLSEIVRATHRDRGEQLGLLQVALPGAANPEQPAREAIIRLIRDSKGALAASAVVYPGEGFLMAAARAFVSGIAMLARPGFPHLVFPTRVEAADWMGRLLPKGQGKFWSAREIAAVVDDLVAHVGERDPYVASLPRV